MYAIPVNWEVRCLRVRYLGHLDQCLIANRINYRRVVYQMLKGIIMNGTIIHRNHTLWDTVKGPPPDLKGKTPFTPFSGFTLGTPVFTHYTPARQGYSSNRKVITES